MIFQVAVLVLFAGIYGILGAISWKVRSIRMAEQDLQTALDTLKTDAAALVTLVTGQQQQIAALSAQIAAGTPVTQAQLDALTAEAQGVVATLSPLVAPPAPAPAP